MLLCHHCECLRIPPGKNSLTRGVPVADYAIYASSDENEKEFHVYCVVPLRAHRLRSFIARDIDGTGRSAVVVATSEKEATILLMESLGNVTSLPYLELVEEPQVFINPPHTRE